MEKIIKKKDRTLILGILSLTFYIVVLLGLFTFNLTGRIPSYSVITKFILLAIPCLGVIIPFVYAMTTPLENKKYSTINLYLEIAPKVASAMIIGTLIFSGILFDVIKSLLFSI